MLAPQSAFTSRVVPTPSGRGEVQRTSWRIRHQWSGRSPVSSPQTSAAGRDTSKRALIRTGAVSKKLSSTGSEENQGIPRPYATIRASVYAGLRSRCEPRWDRRAGLIVLALLAAAALAAPSGAAGDVMY